MSALAEEWSLSGAVAVTALNAARELENTAQGFMCWGQMG